MSRVSSSGDAGFFYSPDSLQLRRCMPCSLWSLSLSWMRGHYGCSLSISNVSMGMDLQTRDIFERHMLTVMSIAGYKVTQVLVLSFSYMPFHRLQLSPVIWRSPLILISVSSIKEKLCCNSAVVSTCLTAVSHGSCMLSTSSRRCFRSSVERGRVVISAPDCLLCSVTWLWTRNGTN